MSARDWGSGEVGGDGGETGLLTKKGKKIDDRYQCQPHPGLKIKRRATI